MKDLSFSEMFWPQSPHYQPLLHHHHQSHYNHLVLSRPTGSGPRRDRRARIQFGRVNFGVFSMSRFMPSALSSDFLTFPLLCCTFHLLFAYFFVLFTYFSHTFPILCLTFFLLFHHFFRTFPPFLPYSLQN